MKAFFNHLLFEFQTGIRNGTLLFMTYLFPLGFYLMVGFIMSAINPFFLESLIPAMIIFTILSSTLLGLPVFLVNSRMAGIFRSFKIYGVPNRSTLFIPGFATALHLAVIALIITLTAPLLFKAPLPTDWPGFLLTIVVSLVACTSLGLLIGVVSSNPGKQILWSQLIFLPSMLLGGLMFPYSMLPDAASKAARLLPATYAMNSFRGLGMGLEPWFNPYQSLILLGLSGIIAFELAVFLFSWETDNSTRKGHPVLAVLAMFFYVIGIFIF